MTEYYTGPTEHWWKDDSQNDRVLSGTPRRIHSDEALGTQH